MTIVGVGITGILGMDQTGVGDGIPVGAGIHGMDLVGVGDGITVGAGTPAGVGIHGMAQVGDGVGITILIMLIMAEEEVIIPPVTEEILHVMDTTQEEIVLNFRPETVIEVHNFLLEIVHEQEITIVEM